MCQRDTQIQHLGCSRTAFPRGMGMYQRNYFSRFTVETPVKYIATILNHNSDIYTNVYSNPQIRENKADKLYIDVDASTLQQAFTAKKSVVSHFRRRFHVQPRTYFTAGKGFAVYIDFPEVELYYRVIRNFVIAEFDLDGDSDRSRFLSECIDTSVLGDKRRVSRIPYTYNTRTNIIKGRLPFLCIPVRDNWSLSKVLSESIRPVDALKIDYSNIEPSDILSSTLLTLNELYEEELESQPEKPKVNTFSEKKAQETIDFLIERAPQIENGRTRIIGFIFVPTLVKMGYALKQVKDVCRSFIKACPDAVFDKYESYIEATYLQDKEQDWNPWSLQTLVIKYPELLQYFDKQE